MEQCVEKRWAWWGEVKINGGCRRVGRTREKNIFPIAFPMNHQSSSERESFCFWNMRLIHKYEEMWASLPCTFSPCRMPKVDITLTGKYLMFVCSRGTACNRARDFSLTISLSSAHGFYGNVVSLQFCLTPSHPHTLHYHHSHHHQCDFYSSSESEYYILFSFFSFSACSLSSSFGGAGAKII